MPTVNKALQKMANTKLRTFIEKGITTSPLQPTDLIDFSDELFARPDVMKMLRDSSKIDLPDDVELESTRLAHVILALRVLAARPTAELVLTLDGKIAVEAPPAGVTCFPNDKCPDEPQDETLIRGSGNECCDRTSFHLDSSWHAKMQARATARRVARELPDATTHIFLNPGSLDVFSRLKP